MAFHGDYGYGAGCGDFGAYGAGCGDFGAYGAGCGDFGACAPAACAPASYCAPAPCAPAPCAPPIFEHHAPMPVAAHHTTVEAWGRPVYKKKWLFGKWKYAGMSDVKYVPRTHMDSFAAAPVCAPTVGCAPGYGGYGAGYGCY